MGWREESEQLEQLLTELRDDIRSNTPFEAWFSRFSNLSSRDRDLYIRLFWPTLLDINDAVAGRDFREMLDTTYSERVALLAECLEAAVNHPNLPTAEPYSSVVNIWQSQRRTATPASAALLAEEQTIVAKYNQILGGLKVDTPEGALSLTQSQNRRKNSLDSTERQQLWESEARARLEVADQIDEIALKLTRLRREIARTCGYEQYAEYVFNRERRFDFTPTELLETIGSIRLNCRDLTSTFQEFRKAQLGVTEFQPWDADFEVHLSAPSNASIDQNTLIATAQKVMDSLDPEFGAVIRRLFDEGRADLWQRKGKQNGAWSTYLSTTGEPLISTNNTGVPDDFFATFHELGHAIHGSLGVSGQPFWFHQCANDISEFAAYTVQCLAVRQLSNLDILSPDQINHLNLNTLGVALRNINDLERQERFTHTVFTLPDEDLNAETLDAIHLQVVADDGINWGGYGEIKKKSWHTHRFVPKPFYASEYITAWVMTMLTLEAMDRDPQNGVIALKQCLRHREWGFKKVISMWGIEFPFQTVTLSAMNRQLQKEFGFPSQLHPT